MVIGVCGIGYTGSGAVFDLLKEYNEIQCLNDVEFPLAFFPDGLVDLEYHLIKSHARYMESDVALLRFKKLMKHFVYPKKEYKAIMGEDFDSRIDRYINNISQVSWRGFWGFDSFEANSIKRTIDFRILFRIYSWVNKFYKKQILLYPNRKMRLSINNNDSFYNETFSLVHDLLIGMNWNQDKKLLLNQPFVGDNPEPSMKFYEDPKAIIVIRDPRDLYIMARRIVTTQATWIPVADIEQFIDYFKILMTNREPGCSNENVLVVRFEDLIYKYDESVAEIEKFLSLKNHSSKLKYFKPDVSVNNTQLFNTFTQFDKEIRMIEDKLAEWLYDFDKYNKRLSNERCF